MLTMSYYLGLKTQVSCKMVKNGNLKWDAFKGLPKGVYIPLGRRLGLFTYVVTTVDTCGDTKHEKSETLRE